VVIKYSSDGVPLWTNRSVGGAVAMAVDKTDRVFVTGIETVAYSSAGVPLWTNSYRGPGNNSFDGTSAIALDGRGNVIVTGTSLGTDNYDLTTLAFSNDGVPLWTNRFNGAANDDDAGMAVAVDASGSAIVTGHTGVGSGYSHFVTIKYSLSVPLAIQKTGNEAVLSWTNAAFGWTNPNWRLQTAPGLTGPFTKIDGATSPYTNPLVGNQRFFRLHRE
jgi:hypothetical protein